MPKPRLASMSNGSCGHGQGHSDGKPHVLVVPYPAQSHMMRLLDLTALLAARDLALTVAVTAGNVPILAPLLAACPSVAVVALAFPYSSHLPAGCGENTKDLPPHLFRPFMASLASLRQPLLSWCKAQTHGVTAIVSDLFTGWTLPVAVELGVPHVTFSSSGALYLAVSHQLWRDMPRRRRLDEMEMVSFPDIPGSPSFPWCHLSWLFRMYVAGDEVSETIRQLFLWNLESSCFVVNSFAALEAAYLRADVMAKRVLVVGPMSEAARGCIDDSASAEKHTASAAAAWLDSFDADSVIYVCFGTQHALPSAQAACLADALALSSVPFIWAVRSGVDLPVGFEAATTLQGTVIRGWVPQVEILRHRAVGWFLTHCGWSSVLEAAAAGVAMLTWPMGADQFTNAWQLAELGVAMPLAEGSDTVPDAREMAKAISSAVAQKGEPVTKLAVELRHKAGVAVAEGGTSYNDLEELVHVITTPSSSVL